MKIKIALDWTPNVIHSGMYLADLNAYYKDAGLEVEFIPADAEGVTKKPVQQLADKEVHMALAPSEHMIDFRLNHPAPLKAVAAVMQKETSAFVTLQTSGIDRPAKLDGKTYAGYQTILEEKLLTSMIQNDGGEGKVTMITPPKLDIFDAFLKEEFDVCWVFMPWEGIIAETEGFGLFAFYLHDFDVPYGYSPVLITREDFSDEERKAIKAFLKAAARGYQEAAQHPEEVAKKLVKEIDHDNFSDHHFITRAMQVLSAVLLNRQGQWGVMKPERWETYAQWLWDHHLLKHKKLKVNDFYTNEWLTDNS